MNRFLSLCLVAFALFGLCAAMSFAQEVTPQVAPAHAPAVAPSAFGLPDTFWPGVIGSFVFGCVGIVLAALSYLVFDLVTPKVSLQDQLNAGNVAVGIVVASLILGAFYLAGVVVH